MLYACSNQSNLRIVFLITFFNYQPFKILIQNYYVYRTKSALLIEQHGVAIVTAGARIHACHEHEAGGIFGAILCSRNSDYAVFQRLVHDFEHIAVELWQLIEKEHAVVSQANFARHGITAASHEGHGTSIRLCGGINCVIY